MSDIILKIDGQEVRASRGMTILDAARSAGISIPTLCHHEKLEPYGACRLCIVEIESRGSARIVVSCVYPAEKNLVVRTRSEKIDRIRKMILELQMAHAPDSFILQDLARPPSASTAASA
jgi:bidirectional [NiFe] hydrogenase diaphorase subunit